MTGMNTAHLVGDESGKVFVETFDWASKFAKLKAIPHLKQYHHFYFNSLTPGVVQCKKNSTCTEQHTINYTLLSDLLEISSDLPDIIHPPGLPAEQQWYLFENIRDIVPDRAKDIVCPKPKSVHHTFAQARAEQKKLSNFTECHTRKRGSNFLEIGGVDPPKRKAQTCLFCGETGHINRVVRGEIHPVSKTQSRF